MLAYVLVVAITVFGSFVMARLLLDDDTTAGNYPARLIEENATRWPSENQKPDGLAARNSATAIG